MEESAELELYAEELSNELKNYSLVPLANCVASASTAGCFGGSLGTASSLSTAG